MPRRSAVWMRMRIKVSLIATAALLCASPARADRRTLIRAYEYMTQPQGNLELEIWNDVEAPRSGFTDATIVHRLELEYGITDHWDAALYHVFESAPGAGTRFDSWRLESRYRFAEKGVWPIDTMVYLEVERPADFAESFEGEAKLILEKSFGNFAVVGNLVYEQQLFSAGDFHAFEIDLGARYEVSPALRLGAEVWTTRDTTHGATEKRYFAGPSVSVATSRFWLQLGAGFGLEIDDAPGGTFVRSVLGINL
jgi:hypothetical protein